MTQSEEIDMLRRAVADLTERVRALEAGSSHSTTTMVVHGAADGSMRGITPMLKPMYAPDPQRASSPKTMPATWEA